MGKIVGIFGIIASILVGLYVGVWLMFIGGIVGCVTAVGALLTGKVLGSLIAISVLKIIFSTIVGWISFAILFLPSWALVMSNE
ncbi:MAG: hypothetical protein ABS939_06835 [Psychrobacillus sp.]